MKSTLAAFLPIAFLTACAPADLAEFALRSVQGTGTELLQQSSPELRARTQQTRDFETLSELTKSCYREPTFTVKQFQLNSNSPGDISVFFRQRPGEPLPADLVHKVAVENGQLDIITTTLGGEAHHRSFVQSLGSGLGC